MLQRFEHLARAAEALVGSFASSLFSSGWYAASSARQRGHRGVAVLLEDLLGRRADVRFLARQHLIEDHAERVEVGALVDGGAGALARG